MNLSQTYSAVTHPQVSRQHIILCTVPLFTEVVEFASIYILMSMFLQTAEILLLSMAEYDINVF